MQPIEHGHRRVASAPRAPQAEHKAADRRERMTVDPADVDGPARPGNPDNKRPGRACRRPRRIEWSATTAVTVLHSTARQPGRRLDGRGFVGRSLLRIKLSARYGVLRMLGWSGMPASIGRRFAARNADRMGQCGLCTPSKNIMFSVRGISCSGPPL
jgi:hypothetical protein